jgi:GT2 family glycosyltransferase
MPDKRKASIIISTYNGRHLLSNSLSSVVEAVEYDGIEHEIIVIDDGSTDGTVEFVRSHYPLVRLIRLEKNKGFGFANNLSVSQSKNGVIILLNNDVEVKKDFIAPLLNHFQDDRIFAVSPKILLPNRDMLNEAITIPTFKRGRVFVECPGLSKLQREFDGAFPIFYAVGAAAAYDKSKFLKLRGFDSLYYPYYCEDADLSYRAWKCGWKVLYEPKSVVIHKHQQTIRKVATQDEIYITLVKNGYFIFIWKNILDWSLLLEHMLWTFLRLGESLTRKNKVILKAFWRASMSIREILRKRGIEKKEALLSDRAIFYYFGTIKDHMSRTIEKRA